RLLTEIEDRPVLHLMLTDGQLRHAVTVRRSGALRPKAGELHVHCAFVQLDLTADVLLPSSDEVVFVHVVILSVRGLRAAFAPVALQRPRTHSWRYIRRMSWTNATRSRK